MSLLVETIRIEDGRILNVSFHNERMTRTLYNIYGLKSEPCLEKIISVPPSAGHGIFKCRVLYDDKTTTLEFLPYSRRLVRSLKIVPSDEICYPYKYTNRDRINRLFEMRGECDDIIIVKFGNVTDSSYANVIFRDPSGKWFTPSTFLLPGTRRANLLHSGLINEADISLDDISKYSEIRLINAMTDMGDSVGIPVSNIITGD
jgi:4-amino-4-deoxychorismate lyase